MFATPFYNGHTRKLIAAFGSLFDDIKVATVNRQGEIVGAMTVPLRYAGMDKTMINDDVDQKPYNEIFPRMSFELSGIGYDADKKTNPNNNIQGIKPPTPYVLDMSLYILSRNLSDALQILEQILPYFNPTLVITMQNTPLPNRTVDVPITLTAVSLSDDYEGEEDKPRRVEISISFSCIVDFYRNVGSWYENALLSFINENFDPSDPSSCTPPKNPNIVVGTNRIEKVITNFYTSKDEFCRLFDDNPGNDGDITPESTVIVEATAEEIRAHDNPTE